MTSLPTDEQALTAAMSKTGLLPADWGPKFNGQIYVTEEAMVAMAKEFAALTDRPAPNMDAYPDGPVTCVCGERFSLYWNGGELDQHQCSCGRFYYGEHRGTAMVRLEPGEFKPWD